jgi:hypothetical protein
LTVAASLAACQSVPDPDAWGAPLAKLAEITSLACPELDKADKAELARRIKRPAEWPMKGATSGDLKAHIDRLEVGQEAKLAAAARVVAEHERCRGQPAKGGPTT